MKHCPKCNLDKPLSDFAKKKNGHQPYCKICNNAYCRKFYSKDRKSQYVRVRAHKKRLASYVRDLKSSTPCKDCGIIYPYFCMDFDHIGDKEFNLANASETGSLKKIKEEISRCEIVCSNCHRKRTHLRMQIGREGIEPS